MTFYDDFVRLYLSIGARDFPCKALGLEWPPPESFALNGVVQDTLVRVSMSQITDDDRAAMTHVARGAEYRYRDELQ